MSSELNQKISQLLDGDLHLLEQQQILRKVSNQTELLNKMNRYQAVSHALKNNDFVIANNDFLAKVNKGLEDEPPYYLPQQETKKESAGFFWGKTSWAMAASVAVVSLIISQQFDYNLPLPQVDGTLSVTEQQLVSIPAATTPSRNEIEEQRANQLAAIQHERLKSYLQAHSNEMYTHGVQDIQPYARVAGFGQE